MKEYKRFKIIIFTVLLFTIGFIYTACTPRAIRYRRKKHDISLAKILVKKELVIGLEYNMPPFCQINFFSQSLNGYDIEIIREMCSRMKIKPIFKNIAWSKKDTLLKTGEIDCIWSCFSYTPDRAKIYTLSFPYIKTASIIMVMDNSPYNSLKDLKDKTIGLQEGFSAALANMSVKYGISSSKVVLYPTPNEALIAMEKGDVDAVIHDLLIADSLINRVGRSYKIIPEALFSDEFVIAFRLGDIALKSAIESVLKDMAKTDFFEVTSKKYFGSNISLIGR